MNRTKKIITALAVTAAAVILTLNAESATYGAKRGISMCFETVIPSLFLFSVLSETAYGLGAFSSGRTARAAAKFLNIPVTCICAVVFSFLGGYPVGVRLIKKEFDKKNADAKTAQRLVSFCVNAGPGFIINTVGAAVLNSVFSGVAVLASTFLSSFITAVVLGFLSKRKGEIHSSGSASENTETASFSEVFMTSVSNSARAMISISAWIILFSALESVLFSYTKNERIGLWLRMIFEVTDGVSAAESIGGAPLCSAVTAFGGICVFMQIYPMLIKIKIKPHTYFIARILNAVNSYAVCSVLIKIFPSAVKTASLNSYNSAFSSSSVSNAVLLIASGVMIMSDSFSNVKILPKKHKST